MRDFRVVNELETSAEIELFGEIASERPWWDDDGNYIMPRDVIDAFDRLRSKRLVSVRLSSVGGNPIAAADIYSRLRNLSESGVRVEVEIEGMAASAATLIACAGDVVRVRSSTLFMVHEVRGLWMDWMGKNEIKRALEQLKSMEAQIVAIYAAKTGRPERELQRLIDAETWLKGQEIVDSGFADELIPDGCSEALERLASALENRGHGIFRKALLRGLRRPNVPTKNELSAAPAVNPIQPITEAPVAASARFYSPEELRTAFPDLVAKIEREASDAATARERARIQAIDSIAAALHNPILVNEAKYEQPSSAEELALRALQVDARNRAQFVRDALEDFHTSGNADIRPEPTASVELLGGTDVESSTKKVLDLIKQKPAPKV